MPGWAGRVARTPLPGAGALRKDLADQGTQIGFRVRRLGPVEFLQRVVGAKSCSRWAWAGRLAQACAVGQNAGGPLQDLGLSDAMAAVSPADLIEAGLALAPEALVGAHDGTGADAEARALGRTVWPACAARSVRGSGCGSGSGAARLAAVLAGGSPVGGMLSLPP